MTVYQRDKSEVVYLGAFACGSRMRVTDPCYDVGTWCAGVLDVEPGIWHAFVRLGETSWGRRVAELVVSRNSEDFDPHTQFLREIDAGVDSGQCGFFDADLYPAQPTEDPDGFYERCCDRTASRPNHAGLLAFGAVASSGFGDGGYPVYTDLPEGAPATTLRLVFIPDGEGCEDEAEDEDP